MSHVIPFDAVVYFVTYNIYLCVPWKPEANDSLDYIWINTNIISKICGTTFVATVLHMKQISFKKLLLLKLFQLRNNCLLNENSRPSSPTQNITSATTTLNTDYSHRWTVNKRADNNVWLTHLCFPSRHPEYLQIDVAQFWLRSVLIFKLISQVSEENVSNMHIHEMQRSRK